MGEIFGVIVLGKRKRGVEKMAGKNVCERGEGVCREEGDDM